jgi:UDP-N-acetylglucosamine 2-epimerase (non-hydrolysing)
MIDTLLAQRDAARRTGIVEELGLTPGRYAVLTLHRPANVDTPAALSAILEPVAELARAMPVVFPVHPRTRAVLDGQRPLAAAGAGVRLMDPVGYLEFVRLMSDARLVLTDSGGIQEETTILGVDCVTLRDNTERPVTVEHGTNRIGGTSSASIRAAIEAALAAKRGKVSPPPLWDGQAGARIASILTTWADRR